MSDPKAQALEAKNKGNAAFQAGDFTAAVKFFSEAIDLDKDNHILYSNRSGAYASLKQFDKALADAKKTIELKPDWGKGYSRLGLAYFSLGKFPEAEKAYTDGLKVEPSNAQLQQGLKEVQDTMDTQGLGYMQSLFGPDVWNKIQSHPKLSQYTMMPDFVKMISDIQANPKNLQLYLQDPRISQVAAVLLGFDPFKQENKQEQPKKEEPKKEEPKKEEPKKEVSQEQAEATKAKEQGNEHYKKKEFQKALECYEKAISLVPDDLTYQLNRAAVYFEMSELDKCIEECKKIIETGRSRYADFQLIAKAFSRLGNAYMKQEKYVEAIDAYNRSLTEHRTAPTLAALQKAEKLKKEKEERDYLDPEKSKEAKEKGNEEFKKQHYPEAIQHYSEAIKRNPSDHVLYSNRSACYVKLGEFNYAMKDCDKCLELCPNFVKAIIRKGNIHFLLKEYNKAIETYDKGLKLEPENQELIDGINKTVAVLNNNQGPDPEAVAKAMADPEIQGILKDPLMRQVLNELQTNPKAAQGYLKDPDIAAKLEKLMRSGVLQMR